MEKVNKMSSGNAKQRVINQKTRELTNVEKHLYIIQRKLSVLRVRAERWFSESMDAQFKAVQAENRRNEKQQEFDTADEPWIKVRAASKIAFYETKRLFF